MRAHGALVQPHRGRGPVGAEHDPPGRVHRQVRELDHEQPAGRGDDGGAVPALPAAPPEPHRQPGAPHEHGADQRRSGAAARRSGRSAAPGPRRTRISVTITARLIATAAISAPAACHEIGAPRAGASRYDARRDPTAVSAPSPRPPMRAWRASSPSSTVAASATRHARDQQAGGQPHQRRRALPAATNTLAALLRLRRRRPSRAPRSSPRCCAARADTRRARPRARRRRARRRCRAAGRAASRSRAARAGRSPERAAGAAAPDASSRASPEPRMVRQLTRPPGGLDSAPAWMNRVEPQPQGMSGPASAAAEIPTRDILGTPVALTDYRGAIDAMDGMVESRERGYVCAVAVHALTVGYDDPEMGEALRGATLVLPGRHAGGLGREPARREARRPRLRARADAALQRPLRRARPPRLALRRARPGLARPARAEPAQAPPRHQHRRRLLAAVPADDAPRRRTRSSSRSTRRARTCCGWASACRSRRSGWRA